MNNSYSIISEKFKTNRTQIYLIWFLTSIFYAFQMTLRVLPGIMMEDVMNKFNLSVAQFGLLSGFYYLGYAGGQIPVGILLDKYNPKFIIPASLALCSIGLLCFSIGNGAHIAYFGRFLIGLGSIAGLLGAIKSINDFLPEKYTIMLGLTIFLGVTGAFYGGKPILSLLEYNSSDTVINYLAFTGLFLALVIMIFYRSNSKNSNSLNLTQSLKFCFSNKKIWQLGLYGGLMVGSIEGFADVWGNKYLVDVYELSKTDASLAISLIFIGLGVGGPLLGFITEKIIDRKKSSNPAINFGWLYEQSMLKTIIYSGLLMIVCYALLFSLNHIITSNSFKPLTIQTICFMLGIFSAYQILTFSIANNDTAPEYSGLVSSCLNMIIMSFGIVFHFAIGIIFESVNAIPNYSKTEIYMKTFSVVIVGIIIGIFGFKKLQSNSSSNN